MPVVAGNSRLFRQIVEELQRLALLRGCLVTSKAVEVVVRSRLVTSESDSDGLEVLMEKCLGDLCSEDPGRRQLLSLQAVFHAFSGSRDTILREYREKRQSWLRPLRRLILSYSYRGAGWDTGRRQLQLMTEDLATYSVMSSGLGSPVELQALSGARDAMVSFLCPGDLEMVCRAEEKQKSKMIEEISEIATGIRLFNRTRGRFAESSSIEDFPNLLNGYLQDCQRLFTIHLDEFRSSMAPLHALYSSSIDWNSEALSKVSSLPWSVIVNQQVIAYVKLMQQYIEEVAVKNEKLLITYTEILERLLILTEHRLAVPSKNIFPLFIKLARTYIKFFYGVVVLSHYEQALYQITQYFQFEIPGILKEGSTEKVDQGDRNDEEVVCEEKEDIGKKCDMINPDMIRSSECKHILPGQNQIDHLEYNGFDPMALLRGYLLEADPTLGMIHFRDSLVGFSSVQSACLFTSDPHRYSHEVVDFIRFNPEYYEILQINNLMGGLTKHKRSERGKRRCKIIRKDVGIQTETHPKLLRPTSFRRTAAT